MLKPTPEQIRAIANMAHNSNWDVVVDWVRDSLIKQSIANNSSVGETTVKNQGRNLELKELLDHIQKVPQYIENERAKK